MVDGDSVNRTAVDESFMTIVRSLLDARRARLNQNGQGIPDALWDGLFLGAILTIGFTYLFGVENFRIQLMMTGLLAALIGVMFSMIVALNYPYRAQVRSRRDLAGDDRKGREHLPAVVRDFDRRQPRADFEHVTPRRSGEFG